ncbi:YSIRK-type signal peptide-containing protein [Staphylococcus aureus]|uniref:YSIRK-type signal peptide-containing protein n=1 Tax=Staphylococcus aureus TaxID=1280 RepID=UPI003BF6E442
MKNLNSKCGRTLSRFSIRKCSVGTASFLIGTVALSAFTTKLLQLKTQKLLSL